MNLEDVLQLVCSNFGIDSEEEAKRKFGKLPRYTVRDILTPILENGRVAVQDLFPEMSRPTILNVLKKLFPNKPKTESTWVYYILHSVELHRCTKCCVIKPMEEFYISKSKTSGIVERCIACDKMAGKTYREENQEKECLRSKAKYLANKEYYIAKGIAYKRGLLEKRPLWANIPELKRIYDNCPDGYHVDHIVPLNGALVSGLHVEHNLQYLSAADNISKSNKFSTDEYIHTCQYTKPYKICGS